MPKSLQFPILRARRKKSVFHFLGSDIRGKSPEELAYAARAGAQVVGSYDAIRWVPDAEVIPPGIDLRAFEPASPPSDRRDRRRPRAVEPAAQGHGARDRRVRAARRRARHRRGPAPRRGARALRRADIVVDQLNAGWYGLFAIEAMALGKPVLTFLHDEAVAGGGGVRRARPDRDRRRRRRCATTCAARRRRRADGARSAPRAAPTSSASTTSSASPTACSLCSSTLGSEMRLARHGRLGLPLGSELVRRSGAVGPDAPRTPTCATRRRARAFAEAPPGLRRPHRLPAGPPDPWDQRRRVAQRRGGGREAARLLVHVSTDVVFDGRPAGRTSRTTSRPAHRLRPLEGRGRAGRRAGAPRGADRPDVADLRRRGAEQARARRARPGNVFYTDELRNPVQVGDLAERCSSSSRARRLRALHVAGADGVSRCEFARLIAGGEVRARPAPPTRPLDCRLDSSRARACSGRGSAASARSRLIAQLGGSRATRRSTGSAGSSRASSRLPAAALHAYLTTADYGKIETLVA